MTKFIQAVLENGPRFMQAAQRNWIGALCLLALVLVVLATPIFAVMIGGGRVASAMFK